MGAKDEESVLQYRRAEIKHGRVCMSSSLGMLVADKFHPIFDNWNEGEFVSSMQSHFSETAVKNFWPAFWIMTAGHELATTFADYDGKEEFDYGFDPLNLRPERRRQSTRPWSLTMAVGQCSALQGLSHRSLSRAKPLSRVSIPFFKERWDGVLFAHGAFPTEFPNFKEWIIEVLLPILQNAVRQVSLTSTRRLANI